MALRMGLLGKKIGMTQSFDNTGACVPVCVIETGPCVVLDVKTPQRDGYFAVQLGFDDKPDRLTKRPQAGTCKRAKTAPKRFIREIRLRSAEEASQFEIGQTLTVGQIFQPGDLVDATGTSKGKGFQGVMKRYHYGGFKASHGTHEYFRHGGSIGCRLTPGRVVKGRKMPGQMGNKRVTVQNIQVLEVIEDKNLLLVCGGIPGPPNGYVVLKQAAKRAPQPLRLSGGLSGGGEPVDATSDQPLENPTQQ